MKKTLMFVSILLMLIFGGLVFTNYFKDEKTTVDTSFFLKEIRNVKELNLFSFQEKYLVDAEGNIVYGLSEFEEEEVTDVGYFEENFDPKNIKSDLEKIKSGSDKKKRKEVDLIVRKIDDYLKNQKKIATIEKKITSLKSKTSVNDKKIEKENKNLGELNTKQLNLKAEIISDYIKYQPEVKKVKNTIAQNVAEKIVLVEYFVGVNMQNIEIDSTNHSFVVKIPDVEILDYDARVLDYLVVKKLNQVTKNSDEKLRKLFGSKKINADYTKIGNDIALDYVTKLYPALVKDSVKFIHKNKI